MKRSKKLSAVWWVVIGIAIVVLAQKFPAELFATTSASAYELVFLGSTELSINKPVVLEFKNKVDGQIIAPTTISAALRLNSVDIPLALATSDNIVFLNKTIVVGKGEGYLMVKITYAGQEFTDDVVLRFTQSRLRLSEITPVQTNKGESVTLTAKLVDANNMPTNVVKVDLQITDPDDNVRTIKMNNVDTGVYEYEFTYDDAGIYYFKYIASDTGYEILPVESSTNVFQTAGLPIFWYYMIGGLAVLLLLIIYKRLRK